MLIQGIGAGVEDRYDPDATLPLSSTQIATKAAKPAPAWEKWLIPAAIVASALITAWVLRKKR